MSIKIDQKVEGNSNNIIGANGEIKITRSPVKTPTFYIYQTSCVDSVDVDSEIEFYLQNGWELIGRTSINGVLRRGNKRFFSPVELRFRKKTTY
ncbi:hypothetical protein [Avibacterium paragallinarum]|uniref:hypothetical protein n=1 Tax=Avibacterium paragallinarum TaxID=728 RepID=UPI001FD6DB67|nr:hypothetical protein [Avibacterium paragallinarum]